MKAMFIFAIVVVLLSTVIFYFVDKYTAIEFPGGIIPFVVMDAVFIAVIVWRMTTPVVEISEAGIKGNIPFLFKKNTARWDEIEGMTINEISNLGVKERQVKILIKADGSTTKEVVFSLRTVEKPDEIIKELRAKIPERGYEDIKKSAVLQKPIEQKEITYRGWTAAEKGLSRAKELIPWDMIKELKYPGFVIGGYGATTITYVNSGGKKRNITIKPSTTENYLTFLRYLMQHAQKAAIDPGLVKALEYDPKEARADILAVMLFITGLISLIITSTFIYYYSTGIATGYINNILILVPLVIVPMLMTLKVLTGRFHGKTTSSSKKFLWPLSANIGCAISIIIFFAISPFSFYWMAGDLYVKMGDFGKAESYYEAAIKKIPNHKDILYEMGKLYREKKDYEKALDNLIKAYTQDPSWWGSAAVVLIPDTLMKMNRYDEALQWCEKIMKDRPNKIDIAKAISRKQDEIISEKRFYEQQNKAQLTERQSKISENPPIALQAPKPVVVPEKESVLTEPQKTESKESAQTALMFPQSSPSKRCGLAPSSGIMRFLSGDYTGNETIDLSINIAFYIYFCLCLFFIARKLQVSAPWTAWIPIVNLWTMVSSAGKPWWWILLFIIPLVNIIVWIVLWMCIAENSGRNKWLGLLMLIPLINFVFMGMLAFSGNEKMREHAPA
jgi:tetratricopeptide (TPR) repeat protein